MSLPLPPADPSLIRRVAFLGTPDIAVPTLHALHDAGYHVPLVVSGADKRRGRGKERSPTPVKQRAIELGIPVSTDVDELLALHREEPIDLAVVVAFGQLIRPHVLAEIPMVNTHFSPLPRWRGAAPVERALLAGDDQTAICVMTVSEGLDEGDVWARLDVPIRATDTLASLWEQMSVTGAEVMVTTIQSGFVDAVPQSGEPVYARKIHSGELRLDWDRTATELSRVVRVGNAWTTLDGERFKVHAADVVESTLAPGEIRDLVVGTAQDGLRLVTVQPAGKPRMDAAAWANGAQPDGKVFDDDGPDD